MMATGIVDNDVLTEAWKELNEALQLLENGQPSQILNTRVKNKIKFAISCINAKQGRTTDKG